MNDINFNILSNSSLDQWKDWWDVNISKFTLFDIDFNHIQLWNISVLHVASFSCLLDIVLWLIKSDKISSNTTDLTGKNFLHCLGLGCLDFSKEKYSIKLLSSILSLIDISIINMQDEDGKVPLHYLIENNNITEDILLCFISINADFTIQDNSNISPLSLIEKKYNMILFKDSLSIIKPYLIHSNKSLTLDNEKRFSLSTARILGYLLDFSFKKHILDKMLYFSILNRWSFTFCLSITSTYSSCNIFEYNNTFILVFNNNQYSNNNNISESILTEEYIDKESQELWLEIVKNIIPVNGELISNSIYCIGHSIGGILATRIIYNFCKLNSLYSKQLHLYSFGQPRPGSILFQKEFDDIIEQAYIIIREDDISPFYPKTSNYYHCGSLRYITKDKHLYNDYHYQFQDIRRLFIPSSTVKNEFASIYKTSQPIQIFRKHWAEGLHLLNDSDTISPYEDYNISNEKVFSEQDILTNTYNNNNINNDLQLYLQDINYLCKLIKKPLINNNAITINKLSTSINIPIDLWDSRIKGIRYQREQDEALLLWIEHYTKDIPEPFSYKIINTSSTQILEWFEDEKQALLQVQILLDQLCPIIPGLAFSLISFKEFHENEIKSSIFDYNIGQLVSIAIIECTFLIEKLDNEADKCKLYQKLLRNLPRTGYALKKQQYQKDKDNNICLYTLTKSRIYSLYRHCAIRIIENFYKFYNIDDNELLKHLWLFPEPSGLRYYKHKKHIPSFLNINTSKIIHENKDPILSIITSSGIMTNTIPFSVLNYRNKALEDYEKVKKGKQTFKWKFIDNIRNDLSFIIYELPINPAMQRACYLLSERICGMGICPSFLGKIIFPNDSKNTIVLSSPKNKRRKTKSNILDNNICIPILLQYIPNDNILLNDTSICDYIDRFHYGTLFLYSILALPSLCECNNIFGSLDSSSQKWKIYIDKSYPALFSNLKDQLYPCKNILFCLDNIINEGVNYYVIKQFLALNVEETLLSWLNDLKIEGQYCLSISSNDNTNTLFTYNEVTNYLPYIKNSKGDKYTSGLLPLFNSNAINEIYIRMRTLQSYWKRVTERGDIVTYRQTFEFLLPNIAKYYKEGLKQQEILIRFNNLSQKLSKIPKEHLIETPISQIESLTKLIKIQEQGDTSNYIPIMNTLFTKNERLFKKKFKKLGLPLREYFISNIFSQHLSQHSHSNLRRKWQDIIIHQLKSNKDWTRLELHNYEYLDDASLHRILSSNPNIEILSLIGCSSLTQIGLEKSLPNLPKLYELDISKIPCISNINCIINHLEIIKTKYPFYNISSASYIENIFTVDVFIIGEYNNTKTSYIWDIFTDNSSDNIIIKSHKIFIQEKEILLRNKIRLKSQSTRDVIDDSNVLIITIKVNDIKTFTEYKNRYLYIRKNHCLPIIIHVSLPENFDYDNFTFRYKVIEFAKNIKATAYIESKNRNDILQLIEYATLLGAHYKLALPSIFNPFSKYFSKSYHSIIINKNQELYPILIPFELQNYQVNTLLSLKYY